MGVEPTTFGLEVQRASPLRHAGLILQAILILVSPSKINLPGLFRKRPKTSLPGGLEPPTFRLTAERANQLRHGSLQVEKYFNYQFSKILSAYIF